MSLKVQRRRSRSASPAHLSRVEVMRLYQCEECGTKTPYGRLLGLELGCYECGGKLTRVTNDDEASRRRIDFKASA